MVGPPAEHAGAPPAEARAGGGGVRLALDLPSAVAGIELAERAGLRGGPAPRGRIGRDHHLGVLRGVPGRAGLEHHHACAGLREGLGGHAAAGAGADDAHVVRRLLVVHQLPAGMRRNGRRGGGRECSEYACRLPLLQQRGRRSDGPAAPPRDVPVPAIVRRAPRRPASWRRARSASRDTRPGEWDRWSPSPGRARPASASSRCR